MAKVVFISHAGADLPKASMIARLLAEAGIEVRYDRQELRLGDSFLGFMESALADSDYCLLLWSRDADGTCWVRVEWEAALYRSVQERRSFLVVGRLDKTPPPALLRPRLWVDLFPELQPGAERIIETWLADRDAEAQSQRPVANAAIADSVAPGLQTIYITSNQFGITVPLKVSLEEPAGVYLDRFITAFELPKVFDHEGRVGVRFSYKFVSSGQPLDRGIPMTAQNVKDKAVLWLETTMTPYSQSEAISGALGAAVFRGAGPRLLEKDIERAEACAHQKLREAILRGGLGS
jgi:hypothetical protein